MINVPSEKASECYAKRITADLLPGHNGKSRLKSPFNQRRAGNLSKLIESLLGVISRESVYYKINSTRFGSENGLVCSTS